MVVTTDDRRWTWLQESDPLKEASKAMLDDWIETVHTFPGQIYETSKLVTGPLGTLWGVASVACSSTYRDLLASGDNQLKIPSGFPTDAPLPEGIIERTGVLMKPHDSLHFLASLYMGTGVQGKRKTLLWTNDLPYVETHNPEEWYRIERLK